MAVPKVYDAASGTWVPISMPGGVTQPSNVGNGQGVIYDKASASWISEYLARQQDLDDLRTDFEDHNHDNRYALPAEVAATVSSVPWNTGTWTAPIIANGKSLLLLAVGTHADASNVSQKSAGLATTNAAAAPDIVDCGGYAGWLGIGVGTGTFLPMQPQIVPASSLKTGTTYYLNVTAGATGGSYPLSCTLKAYWI